MRRVLEPAATGATLRVLAIAVALTFTACADPEPADSAAAPAAETGSAETTATAPSTTESPPGTTATTAATTSTSTPPSSPLLELLVPASAPPVIDGILDEGEWADAAGELMSDGATVRWMHAEETLHVAVEGTEIGAVNVLIATEDQVLILHSSAALGSALYAANAATWELVHGFSWCCRNTADESGPSQLFADEDWKANIGFAGDPGVVEYAIALPWQGAAVAVSSIRDENDMGFWPAVLSEEAREQLLGVPPPERDFSIDEWVRLSPTG